MAPWVKYGIIDNLHTKRYTYISNRFVKFPQNTKNGITQQILIHFRNLKSKNAVNFKLYLSVIKSISQLLSMIQKKWNLIFDYTRQ